MSSRAVPRQRDPRGRQYSAEQTRTHSLTDNRSTIPPDQSRPHSVPPPTTSNGGGPGTLAVTLPTLSTLERVMTSTLDSFSDMDKLHWAQDVVRLLDRYLKITSTKSCPPHFRSVINVAVPIIVSFTTHRSSTLVGSSCYLKAHLHSTGACQDDLPKDSRQSFKDFEIAARAGENRAWFRLGRDYETCGEQDSARTCFERGASKGDAECIYRMGMAHLMGQLGLPSAPSTAISLLRRAANLSSIDAPQAAYVFGMLLAGEFDQVAIPSSILLPPNAAPCRQLEGQHSEARAFILRAAYLCFPPAQYKAGYMYEHAQLGGTYDPLLSVQYYSLASQNGELDADMALSKWYLVGAEGSFDENKPLARTFAHKAATAGLASGCFALGYYYEFGIGGNSDIEKAMKWYKQSADSGNKEAVTRLRALDSANPDTLSSQDYLATVNSKLVRKRTDARLRSERVQPRANREESGNERMRAETHKLAYRASVMPMHGMGPTNEQGGYDSGYGRTGNAPSGKDSPPLAYIPGRHGQLPQPAETQYQSNQHARYHTNTTLPLDAGSAPSRQPRPSMTRRGAIANGDGHPRQRSASPSPLMMPQSRPAPSETLELNDRRREAHSLQDPGAVERQRTTRPPRGGTKQDLGAATFEEMGFVSKPVKDEDCKVM